MVEEIYTDGAFLRSKNAGGAGVHFEGSHEDISIGPYQGTTSNRMEILALCLAVENVAENPRKVVIYSDSQYCVNTINVWYDGWVRKKILHTKKNLNLWARFMESYGQVRDQVAVKWIKGHNGNPGNEEADRLASDAADRTSRPFHDNKKDDLR